MVQQLLTKVSERIASSFTECGMVELIQREVFCINVSGSACLDDVPAWSSQLHWNKVDYKVGGVRVELLLQNSSLRFNTTLQSSVLTCVAPPRSITRYVRRHLVVL